MGPSELCPLAAQRRTRWIMAYDLYPVETLAAKRRLLAAAEAGNWPLLLNHETKTPAGRKRYDAAVVDAVRAAEGPVSASQLRSVVGGTPLQTRTALNRLIDAGKIKWTGKARGTRYRVA